MLPVIALVGRPNVGKSTLFNRLTRSQDALVADVPGLTRDRHYGIGKVGPYPYLVVDTGGLTDAADELQELVARQALQAVEEADLVLLLTDARAGLTATDQTLAMRLRAFGKRVFVVANKAENLESALAGAEFHALGLGPVFAIAAVHNQGVDTLIESVCATLAERGAPSESSAADDDQSIRFAIVGRPNVGKSTLVNRLLGEERVLTYDQPGTTRDSIAIPFTKDGRRYTLIDTAGVRRRARVTDVIEKFSVIKTLQAVQQAHVVVMMIDARQGVGEQDASLLGFILDSGRALVIAVNKWDGLDGATRAQVRRDLSRKLAFLDFAEIHFISALHGSGVMDILDAVDTAYASATRELPTSDLTRILEKALADHQPPLVHGHSIKLRYAHQGGRNPPLIVIHGNRIDHVPESYRRYLANTYRKLLKLKGTPVRIEFKSGANPYRPQARPRRAGERTRPKPKRATGARR
ncbi:MAG: ribosome biogenesis GTPase Der [Gammaproteobacteria bacterium]